ncbi:glutamate-cysteine ligase family protein [Kamptonema sp. UHCC 0994]|uniref:glutamate-cysteine ligase family protein n=1 Tax=Kamptonema sp. UHCC 0994 TaxID=3031329 RepID=UPI0023B9C90C|nr:glutamate-cysteine ligase family protein [Kamptonema sp. UHCC 0994]MDF0556051.1 glutamate-cysteine ligase family protein [Kamptonema sp. UHCC 0994]
MNKLIKKIGLELEMPLVQQDGLAAGFDDVEKLLQDFSEQGWSKKFDPNTEALISVGRETSEGLEVVSTDVGVCTLEVALAPVNSIDEAIKYWHDFKSSVLLPKIKNNHLKVLGYGTQPISAQLQDLISKKGHHIIWKNMIEEDSKEWIFQNFPGICSVQFNFQVSKEKTLEITNTFLQLLAFLWAASANDSIAASKKLPYKSQRFYAYLKIARGRMYCRSGLTIKPYLSLCDYINRTWSVSLFEIIRDGRNLYPQDMSLTTNKFINEKSAYFYSLDGILSQQKIELEDLKLAIYLYWPDFRLKFNFYPEIQYADLVSAVHSNNDEKLLELIEYMILEVRPIAMQSNEEELSWMIFSYLIIENLESISEYASLWTYQDVKSAVIAAQNNGLRQSINGKNLGEIGLDLLAKIPKDSFQMYEQYLSKLDFRCREYCSPGDDASRIFEDRGMEMLLDYLTIKC